MKKCYQWLIALFISVTLTQSAYALFSPNKISYRAIGKGQPIIFIHAFPTDKDIFRPQEMGLGTNYRVIVIDLWGFGGTPNTDGSEITMSEYADEVYQPMQMMNISKCVIAGESMGGYVALALLNDHPDVVSGLILSDTQTIAEDEQGQEQAASLADNVMENGPVFLQKAFMQTAISPNASRETWDYLANIVDHQTAEAISSALLGMADRSDMSQVLAHASIPTLIITGADDKVILPAQSQAMHKLAKGSTLVVIPHAAHLSNLDQPDAWNKAASDFLAKINN